MKFVADFLPVLLFFATYFLGEAAPQKAHALALDLLGGVVKDGTIPPELSAILLASAVAIVAITVQIAVLLVRRRHVSPMLWTSFAIFVLFGGATIYFHDDAFIKWKPTVLYWIFGVALLVSDLGMRRNLIRSMVEPNGIRMSDSHWRWLNVAWILFFWTVGFINLYVAFHLSRSVWVSFKSFGLTGLTLVFVIVQSLFLARHMHEETPDGAASDAPTDTCIPPPARSCADPCANGGATGNPSVSRQP